MDTVFTTTHPLFCRYAGFTLLSKAASAVVNMNLYLAAVVACGYQLRVRPLNRSLFRFLDFLSRCNKRKINIADLYKTMNKAVLFCNVTMSE